MKIKRKQRALTLPISGETVIITPVSYAGMMTRLIRANPRPQPPLVKVNLGGGPTTYERNIADPTYAQAVADWEQYLQLEVAAKIVHRIAIRQKLDEEKQAQVDEIRAELSGEDLPGSDKVLWFFEVAIQSDEDYQAIVGASRSMADPQEDNSQAAARNFQD